MFNSILTAALAFAFFGLFSQANAAAAPAGPAPQKFQVGKFTVWSIADNTGDRDMSVFLTDADTIKKYAPTGKCPSGLLCLLVRSGDRTVLIDTGNGNPPGGPNASLLMAGLQTIGIKPADIDTILITHIHGDHVGGLARDGKPVFPNATLLIGRVEHDFWLDEASNLRLFPDRKANFELARRVVDMYGDKAGVFDFGEEIIPGLTAVDARGHTPGHTAFLLESGEEKFLCVGDLLHSAALQFARPDINASYDMLPKWAQYTRTELLERAVWDKMPIAGMHLPFPGVGRVAHDGPHGYTFR